MPKLFEVAMSHEAPERRTLEEIARYAAEWSASHDPDCGSWKNCQRRAATCDVRNVYGFILAALREAADAERERLYQTVVNRISADIAGDFELALDQLEFNAAKKAADARDAEWREVVVLVRDGFRTMREDPDTAEWICDEILKRLDSRKDQA